MPKLLLFVPCERVIIGQGDNSVSLIVIVQKLQLNQVAPKLDENQAMLARISLFSEWQKTAGDQGKVYEQRFTFGASGQKPNVEAVMEFTISERTHRTVALVEVLPFLPQGQYEFSVWLREKGENNWPNAPAGSYPVELAHGPTVLAHK